jgi:hypothetical protein
MLRSIIDRPALGLAISVMVAALGYWGNVKLMRYRYVEMDKGFGGGWKYEPEAIYNDRGELEQPVDFPDPRSPEMRNNPVLRQHLRNGQTAGEIAEVVRIIGWVAVALAVAFAIRLVAMRFVKPEPEKPKETPENKPAAADAREKPSSSRAN